MAELRTVSNHPETIGRTDSQPGEANAFTRHRGPAPVWRSLISPSRGQRAMVLGDPATEVFSLLRESGVQVERGMSTPRAVGGRGFDFILEELTGWGSQLGNRRAASLLSEKGRWIIAVHGDRVVGLKARFLVSQLRRQGFGSIERYYAHASIWSPEVLVPLERHEPFEFFLRLTVGGGAMRRRAILAAFRALGRMGIHREFLPNCIVVARRSC